MRCRSSLLLPQSGLCDLDQPSPVLGAKQTARCGSTAPESQPDSQLLRDSQFVRLQAEKSPGWNLARPSAPGCVKTSPSRECAELFSLSSSPIAAASTFSFQIEEIEPEFLHADWTPEFSRNQDPKRTVDPSAIRTARASFRSCSRFPI